MNNLTELGSDNCVAIIGMACNFPGARNVSEYWHNLLMGMDCITRFNDAEINASVPQNLKQNPNYVKARGIIADVDKFDASFFGFNSLEAEVMDPQHRIFLETAWQAFEDAGYVPGAIKELVGVYAGMGNNTYFTASVSAHQDKIQAIGPFQAMLLNEKDYLATRISYKMDLTGPSLSIYTACSTSLVTVCQACESLISYQCDMAIAGGVSIVTPQNTGYLYEEGMIASSDGICRPFDRHANGTIFSNGSGAVILKRYGDAVQDNDRIYTIIRGTAINNDGANKVGFSAPSVSGQIAAIRTAQANAEVTADSISYIEAHGSATQLGDAIEIDALTQVFRSQTEQKNFCGIGSVKGNIGHLDAAAGVAGLIKCALALHHRKIPPSIHFEEGNPKIDIADSPFFVVNKLMDWRGKFCPRRAAVSSFGIGGTNAHLIMEEAPRPESTSGTRPTQLIVLSAKTQNALEQASDEIAKYLFNNSEINLADAAYTLQTGRAAFNHRKMIVCKDHDDLHQRLNERNEKYSNTAQTLSADYDLVFMFPGQGSHYVNMGRNLYEGEPLFRYEVDKCAEMLGPHIDLDIRNIIYPGANSDDDTKELLRQTQYNQPALFTIEWALARLLMHWGIAPSSMIGHSIGEYVAACIANVFSLDHALKLVAVRGRFMQELPKGSMISVFASADVVKERMGESLSIAAINAPELCVVSGASDLIDQFSQELRQDNIKSRLLETSHAFHSEMMEPIVEKFRHYVQGVPLSIPEIPFISGKTGDWILDSQAVDPGYWASHLRQSVLFSRGIGTLLEAPGRILLEVGPRNTCTTLARQHTMGTSKLTAIPTLQHTSENDAEWDALLSAVGTLWVSGISVDWKKFYENETRYRVSLPTYPFERKTYWLSPSSAAAGNEIDRPLSELPSEVTEADHPCCDIKINQLLEDYDTKTSEDRINNEGNIARQSAKPSTCTQRVLAKIWEKVLPNVKIESVQSDFFELGGHSLLSVQLLSEVKRVTGVHLPLSVLVDAPTLKQMAEILDGFDTLKLNKLREMYDSEKRSEIEPTRENPHTKNGLQAQLSWAHLVALNKSGNRTPFFCVHGIGGNILNYKQFVGFLDPDQPLYGLQAKGIDGISRPFDSIEDMARQYIKEIRNVQPFGPYRLGGGSMGGMVALEMAQQLLHDGQEISSLIMFDTFGPNSSGKESFCLGGSFVNSAIYTKIRITKISRLPRLGIRWVYRRVHDFAKMTRCELQRKLGIPLKYTIRYWYLERKHLNLLTKYRPKVYDKKIILFRAYPERTDHGYDPLNGWRDMARQGVEVVEIPGEHYSFVEEPKVGETLAIYLRNEMNVTVQ